MEEKYPIMGTKGALDWQNNGYKSTASAIAELVDNSIQAKATMVEIIIIEKKAKSGWYHVNDIYVVDNGEGMDKNTFQIALQFGGGNRFGATNGLGRYGMGLPNSSVSQTKRFEVYTWKKANQERKLYYNYVDLDEVVIKDNPYLNIVQEVTKFDKDLVGLFGRDVFPSETGTIVKWKNANRVRPKTASGLIGHLKLKIGKMFRYYLTGEGVEKVTISIKTYQTNGPDLVESVKDRVSKLKPYDPLFLMENTQVSDICGNQEYNKPTSIEYAPAAVPFIFTEIGDDGEKKVHEIRIRYSYINPELRRKLGRNAGDTALGKQYLKKGNDNSYQNISIVRAKREIDSGSFDFITALDDQTNRFWSVEIQIESISDEIFGIDNRKQQASKFKRIDSHEDPFLHDEPIDKQILRQISESIFDNLKEIKLKVKEGATTSGNDGKPTDTEPPLPGGGGIKPVPGSGDGEVPDEKPIDELREQAKIWFLDKYPEYKNNQEKLEEIIDWFLDLTPGHYLVYSDLPEGILYDFKPFNDKTIIEVSLRHLFYQKLIERVEESDNTEAKHILRYLFSSLVNAERKATNEQARKVLINFRLDIARVLGDLISSNEDGATF